MRYTNNATGARIMQHTTQQLAQLALSALGIALWHTPENAKADMAELQRLQEQLRQYMNENGREQ
jgi:hypothetical protein